jgi:hypothetical protein
MFEDQTIELLPARTVMTILGTGGGGGRHHRGGNTTTATVNATQTNTATQSNSITVG